MQTSNKAVSEEVKSLSSGVEEGVNSIKSAQSGSAGLHSKIVYKRYTFDFFKEEGGYMEKISLNLPGEAKKKAAQLTINSFLLVLGDTVKIDYTIEEET